MASFEEQLFSDPPSEEDEAVKRALAVREIRKDEFFAELLADPAGRMWVWDKLKAWWVFDDLFVGGGSDETAARLGARSAGLELWAQMQRVAPQAWLLMVEENRA